MGKYAALAQFLDPVIGFLTERVGLVDACVPSDSYLHAPHCTLSLYSSVSVFRLSLFPLVFIYGGLYWQI